MKRMLISLVTLLTSITAYATVDSVKLTFVKYLNDGTTCLHIQVKHVDQSGQEFHITSGTVSIPSGHKTGPLKSENVTCMSVRYRNEIFTTSKGEVNCLSCYIKNDEIYGLYVHERNRILAERKRK